MRLRGRVRVPPTPSSRSTPRADSPIYRCPRTRQHIPSSCVRDFRTISLSRAGYSWDTRRACHRSTVCADPPTKHLRPRCTPSTRRFRCHIRRVPRSACRWGGRAETPTAASRCAAGQWGAAPRLWPRRSCGRALLRRGFRRVSPQNSLRSGCVRQISAPLFEAPSCGCSTGLCQCGIILLVISFRSCFSDGENTSPDNHFDAYFYMFQILPSCFLSSLTTKLLIIFLIV